MLATQKHLALLLAITFWSNLAIAQADSVNSRQDFLRTLPIPPAGLNAITRGPTANAWIGGINPNTDCSSARINNTGVILSVTVVAPTFGTTAAYTMESVSANWQNGATAHDSATAQVFVPPGGLFCVTTRNGVGNYFVTVFKANAQESEYPLTSLWNDSPAGIFGHVFLAESVDSGQMACVDRPVFRRTYTSSSNRPTVFYVGTAYESTNPANGGCAVVFPRTPDTGLSN